MRKKIFPVSEREKKIREELEGMDTREREEKVNNLHERALLENSESFYEKSKKEIRPERKEELLLSIRIAEAVKEMGGMALVVGGYARDEALRRFGYDIDPKDIDIEVFGISSDALFNLLKKFGEPNTVGASYEVIKIGGLDISIPRRDSKSGKGHKGFIVKGDPSMTFAEAARRRDFTINAMGLDLLTGEIVDEYGGFRDMQEKILRATDITTFGEDPLRVFRAMQFAGRFEFMIDKATVRLCRSFDPTELSSEPERIGDEWEKLILKSPRPSVGLEAARELGILERLHPELNALIGVPQEEEWHPEGDVWTHTKMTIDAAAEIIRRHHLQKEESLVVLFASLCHDFGKPETTRTEKGKIISYGHAEAGLAPTERFLKFIKVPQQLIGRILPLVKDHLFPAMNNEFTDASVRRLAHRLSPATIQELVWVSEADQRGRDFPWHGFSGGEKLLQKAEMLSVSREKTKPIFMGRHLVAMKFAPGKKFGKILAIIYEEQLDGKIKTLEEAKQRAVTLWRE